MDFWNTSQRMDFVNMDPQLNSVPHARVTIDTIFSSPGDINVMVNYPSIFQEIYGQVSH